MPVALRLGAAVKGTMRSPEGALDCRHARAVWGLRGARHLPALPCGIYVLLFLNSVQVICRILSGVCRYFCMLLF